MKLVSFDPLPHDVNWYFKSKYTCNNNKNKEKLNKPNVSSKLVTRKNYVITI